MPTSVWCKKAVVDIHQIYTRLSWVKESQTSTGTTQSELEHYSDLFTANKNGVIPKRILVQGQTGIGKSTFVKKLLVDWVDEQATVLKNFELVVAVNLKEVSKCQSLKDVIRLSNVFAKEDKYMTDGLVDYITNNQEKVLLIFDGYDEYRSGLDSEIYEIFSGKSLRSCCVLITTRISKADELRGGEDLHAEITGFSKVDRRDFMLRFLNCEEVSELEVHLYERQLEELAKVPLLLLFFCILWRNRQSKSFPKSKTKLYVDIVQFILNHSHSKKTGDETKTKQYVKLNSFKEILSEIGKVALQSLLKDDHLFEYSQLSDSVRCDESVVVGLLQITEYSETLQPVGKVSFIHKSIQEFLAAWYITYRCIPEGGNLGEIGVKLEECLDVQNVFQFMCGLSDDGTLAALRHFKSVRISDPSLDLSKTIPHGGNKTDLPLNVVTIRQRKFNNLVLNAFDEVESKAELSRICLDCVGNVLVSSLGTRPLPKELLIKATETNSFSLIIRKVGESLNKIVKILVSKSSKTFNVADFLEKFENSSPLSPCRCWFGSIFCFRNGQVYFYITDLLLSCLPHARLFTDKLNFSMLSSALHSLRKLELSLPETEYFNDSICHLLEQVSNPQRCYFFIERCFLTLTSKGAVKFASLLPKLQKVDCLYLHLAECSAEAVLTLVAAIKHKSLKVLELSEIILTPAVVESLSQSLPELTALEILKMKGSNGCNLRLDIPVYSSSFGTLTITGLTENAAKAITRLFDVFKHKPVDKVELSVIKLTSTLADALGQLLPELSASQALSLGSLTECSDEAVTKLVASIRHKNLDQLCLRGINLTSAVAEALCQLLRETLSLRTLSLSGSDGCTLWLSFPVSIWNRPGLEIRGSTDSSAEGVLSLIGVIKNKTIKELKLSNIDLTSAVAEALAQLLPELSALQALSLGSLTECSDEAVTKLVASIRHKNLDQLCLRGINLTSAVAEALCQLLRETLSLRTLSLSGSDGCTLWLSFPVSIWNRPGLEIRGSTDSSAEGVLSLIGVIKNKTIKELKLSNIDLTSAVAEALAQLLPELSALQALSLGSLTECSDEAVTKLVASIKHKNLDELNLHGINLTSAVAEALGQLLPELSALRTLSLGASTSLDAPTKHKTLERPYLPEINLTPAAAEAHDTSLPELSALQTLSIRSLTECSDEAVTKLVASIKHKHLDRLYLHGIDLTSAAAEALGQLLPVLSSLRTLSLGSLTECSDEAVTKLVASIKHKNLDELYLHGISLTSAVAQALGQLLREPSSLQVLELCFSDGCTLWLSLQTLEIRGLSESSAEVVSSLIEVSKNRTIEELELSNIALTSATAGALGQLLTELSTLRTLTIGASTECSDEAVTRLVATTKHKTLEELYLPGIQLTPAVAKALGQLLLELSSLRKLTISGSDGCSLQHKELEALFGRCNRPSSLIELSITHFSARESLGSIANNLCFFPSLIILRLEDLDMCEADLSDLLENLKFTPDLRRLNLKGNPLGHAVRSMIPYLLEQQKLGYVFFRQGDCSEEDLKYVQQAVKEKRPQLKIVR